MPALHHRALADACSVVDSLDAKCREELITWFCHQQLQPYQMLFVDATGLGRTEERYAWILRHLKSYEERYGDVYPPAWGVCYQLCLTFCQTTREQLAECAGLARGGAKDLEVGALVQVILPTAPGVSNEGGSGPLLVPLPAVSWPWVPAWGSLEPPRRDGENAQKMRKNGEKMGEIRPKECEPRELNKDQLAGW